MEPYHLERNTRMKKPTKKSSGALTVTIARLGEDSIDVSVGKGTTVGQVVEEAGLTLSSNEKLYINSDEAKDHFIVDDGDHISVIGKKEGGSDEEEAPVEETAEAPAEDAPSEETADENSSAEETPAEETPAE